MERANENETYSRLLSLKPDGMSLNAWTVRAGMSRSIFTEIRKHGNPTRDTLDRLLAAIGMTYADFERAGQTGRIISEVAPAPLPDGSSRPGGGKELRIPLLGSAIGGEFEEDVELTELYVSETLEWLAPPPGIASDKGAYAVTIVGDSMAPRFEPGEVAYVSPRKPAAIGDDVIVQLKKGENGGEDGDRVTMVLIKRLKKRSAAFVELEQFNPSKVFRIEMKRIAAIHRVVGRF